MLGNLTSEKRVSTQYTLSYVLYIGCKELL